MARKIRDFVYGSPKFERKINEAVSGSGDVKVYQHNITILANDASNTSYYYEYTVYNTSSDPLIDTYTPTYMDVINLLIDTITFGESGLTPSYFEEGKFYYFNAIKGEENSLTAYYYDIQSQDYSEEKIITNVSVAYDVVREM